MDLKCPEEICGKIEKRIQAFIAKKRKAVQMKTLQDFIKYEERMPFVKEVIVSDGVFHIKLKGAIDSSTLPLVGSERKSPMEGQYHVLLDFKDVEHIDSVTLGELVKMIVRLKAHHKGLAIVNATAKLKTFIDIMRLDSIIKVYDSEKDAIAAFA